MKTAQKVIIVRATAGWWRQAQHALREWRNTLKKEASG